MPCSRCRTGRRTDNDGNPEQSRAQSVALPTLGLTLSTASSPQVPPAIRQFRMIVSRTRAPGVAFRVVERLGADAIEMGSAEAKTTAVVRGQADIHLHVGGQHEWVSAAPIAVALVSGLHVSRLDGSALRCNQAEAWPPDQLVYQLELAPRVVGTRAACQ
jgi:3'(2'), 5'-bisphosphate nucleotidase